MNRVVACLVMGGCAFLGGAVAVSVSPKLQAQLPTAAPSAAADLTTLSDRFEAIARRLAPAVVSIEAIKPSGAKPDGKPRTVEDSGSGVLIAADDGRGALVITNNHVVTGAAAGQISVNLSDGRLLKPTQVLADPETDVAILRVDGTGLPLAPLGDSDRARVGQWVLAVGSPFGLSQSITHGIISARERGSVSLGNTIRIKDFLQTDAAINPGSSGGPLVNLDGEVIGINTAIASPSGSNSGVAFSIPINMVKRITRQLLEKGSVTRGYLGVQVASAFEPGDAEKRGLFALVSSTAGLIGRRPGALLVFGLLVADDEKGGDQAGQCHDHDDVGVPRRVKEEIHTALLSWQPSDVRGRTRRGSSLPARR